MHLCLEAYWVRPNLAPDGQDNGLVYRKQLVVLQFDIRKQFLLRLRVYRIFEVTEQRGHIGGFF